MKIKFCGAAKTVTGSCHLLTLNNGYKILLDCGLYQGRAKEMEDFNREWLFKPTEIDCLVLSHAHIDHSGRVPRLVKDGFKGNIISTHATRDLCTIMLLDSAHIQQKDAEYINRKKDLKGDKKVKPLYEKEHVEQTMTMFTSVSYEHWHTITPGVEVLFRDAGHILGSASVTIKITQDDGHVVKFGFTGDIGRPDRPILKDPKPMPQVDFLISESTYGGREHSSAPQDEEHLLEIINNTCVKNRGKLIIPAFSVGRTQEIVYMFDKLHCDGKMPQIPVFVDSPLAVNATDIFRLHPECFDQEIMQHIIEDPDPFGFNRLHYVKKVEDSKKLNDRKDPCVIISASGMITAGRILHHIRNNIENPNNTVLIVGYCAPQTYGGRLRKGVDTIKMFGQELKVRAQILVMDSFSAHGDQSEMLDYLDNQSRKKLKKLFLCHGDEDRANIFRDALLEKGFRDVIIPHLGENVVL